MDTIYKVQKPHNCRIIMVAICFHLYMNSLFIENNSAHNIVRWVLGNTQWTIVASNASGVGESTSLLFSDLIGVE